MASANMLGFSEARNEWRDVKRVSDLPLTALITNQSFHLLDHWMACILPSSRMVEITIHGRVSYYFAQLEPSRVEGDQQSRQERAIEMFQPQINVWGAVCRHVFRTSLPSCVY